MLVAYRRHNPAKCKFTSRSEYRCKCPIWVTGTDKDGKFLREALKIRDWNRAQELVRRWDVDGEKPTQKVRTTIEQWRDQFLQDAVARNLSHGTMRLYKLLFRQLLAFAIERGITLANYMDLTALTEFRATWKLGSLTASKKLERLRSVYKFAVQRKMVDENFALGLVAPKVKPNPTLPFPQGRRGQDFEGRGIAESGSSCQGIHPYDAIFGAAYLRCGDAGCGQFERQSADTVSGQDRRIRIRVDPTLCS
jgi:integrase/recombinase XerD